MNKKHTILIVDDEVAIIQIVSLILTNAGYDIIADSNADLLFLQTNVYPDLILLDNQLGIKSGADICKQLKTNERTKHIPVMLVSATEGLPEIATYACADDFLPKPFDVETLLQKVESLLNNMDMAAAC